MTRFLALSLLAGTAVALDASKVEMLLSTLWAQTDVQPQDDALSYQEFVTAANTLGLDPNILDVAVLVVTVEAGCTYINGIFTEFENLFLPGLTCVCAVCYAMFVNNTLCCAAGCCCKAPKSDAMGPDKAHTPHVVA